MGELGGESQSPEGARGVYGALKTRALEAFPDIVAKAAIERDPGDAPRNLRIFLNDESFLDVWVSASSGKYSFHWQSGSDVVRFDNAPHHDVETFPHHVHIDEDVEVSPLEGDTIEDFDRVLTYLKKRRISESK